MSPKDADLDNAGRRWVWGCALTNKTDDRSHSGFVLIRQNSRKNSWILKPSIFRCNSSGLKAFCSLNCSKNKYFRRGLNLNVQDSVFFMHHCSWKELVRNHYSPEICMLWIQIKAAFTKTTHPHGRLEVLVKMQLWEVILANSVLWAAESFSCEKRHFTLA